MLPSLSCLLPPAKGEGTAHQQPMPPDCLVATYHEVGPAEFILHLLVALLDPVPQPVQAHHFLKRRLFDGQVGRQVPSRQFRQRPPVRRRAYGAVLACLGHSSGRSTR